MLILFHSPNLNTHIHPAVGKQDLLTYLGMKGPAGLKDGWYDELRPNVLLEHLLFFHDGHPAVRWGAKGH